MIIRFDLPVEGLAGPHFPVPGHTLGGRGVELLLHQGTEFVGYRLGGIGGCRLRGSGLLASLVFPQLTTVALHSAEMGSRAAAMLIDQIVDNQQARVEILQPGELVVRGSVAPPPDLPA